MPMRDAASSIASGSPSTRRQISRTRAWFRAVELGVRLERQGPLSEQLDGIVDGERRNREDVLPGNVEHCPARDDQGDTRRAAQKLDEQRSGIAEVLGVVENQ